MNNRRHSFGDTFGKNGLIACGSRDILKVSRAKMQRDHNGDRTNVDRITNAKRLQNIDILNAKIQNIIKDISASCSKSKSKQPNKAKRDSSNKENKNTKDYNRKSNPKLIENGHEYKYEHGHEYKHEHQHNQNYGRQTRYYKEDSNIGLLYDKDQMTWNDRRTEKKRKQSMQIQIASKQQQHQQYEGRTYDNSPIKNMHIRALLASRIPTEPHQYTQMEMRLGKIADKIEEHEKRMMGMRKQLKHQLKIQVQIKQKSVLMEQSQPQLQPPLQSQSQSQSNSNTNNTPNQRHAFPKKESYFHQQYKYHVTNDNRRRNSQSKLHPNLLQALLKQIELDRDFRQAKHMYAGLQQICDGDWGSGSEYNNNCEYSNNYNFNYNNSHNNDYNQCPSSDVRQWKALQRQLAKEGIHMSIEEVQQTFTAYPDEVDPFQSVSQSHYELLYSLLHAYTASLSHFQSCILHAFSHWHLQQSNFTIAQIDIERKGYIAVEDIVRFINVYGTAISTTCGYRNRDLMVLWKRIAGNAESIRFGDISALLLE